MFDACANGQQVKCLTVIEEYTRECLAIDVAGRIRSSRVIEGLTELVSVHGAPAYLFRHGPEFVSRDPEVAPGTSTQRTLIRASRGRAVRTNRSTASSATSA